MASRPLFLKIYHLLRVIAFLLSVALLGADASCHCAAPRFQCRGKFASSSSNIGITGWKRAIRKYKKDYRQVISSPIMLYKREQIVQSSGKDAEGGGSPSIDGDDGDLSSADRTQSYRRKPQGVLTRSQRRALRELWPDYGIDAGYNVTMTAQTLQLEFGDDGSEAATTGGEARLILDVGFGSGEETATTAEMFPSFRFLGVEVHKPGLASLLKRIRRKNLTNVRVVRSDVITLLADRMKGRVFDEVWVLFPDPWSSFNKRRLIRPYFLTLLSQRLNSGGVLRVASDVKEYIEHVEAVMDPLLQGPAASNDADGEKGLWVAMADEFRDGDTALPTYRGATHYEQRALMQNGSIWERAYCWTSTQDGP